MSRKLLLLNESQVTSVTSVLQKKVRSFDLLDQSFWKDHSVVLAKAHFQQRGADQEISHNVGHFKAITVKTSSLPFQPLWLNLCWTSKKETLLPSRLYSLVMPL